jgi:hypothetical protein
VTELWAKRYRDQIPAGARHFLIIQNVQTSCTAYQASCSQRTGCLQDLVRQTVAIINKQMYPVMPVVFEDVRFIRATNIPKEGKCCGAVVQSFMIAVFQVDCFMCVCVQHKTYLLLLINTNKGAIVCKLNCVKQTV